jgi:hypothetical protein
LRAAVRVITSWEKKLQHIWLLSDRLSVYH